MVDKCNRVGQERLLGATMIRSLGAAAAVAVALVVGGVAPAGAASAAGLPPVTVRDLTGAAGEAMVGYPLQVNERGQVAGAIRDASGPGLTAAVWHRGAVTRVAPAGVSALPSAISERGHVVGERVEPAAWRPRPFSWQRGEWVQLVPDESAGVGLAMDVNRRGQVLGFRSSLDTGAGVVVWHDGEATAAPGEVVGGLTAPRGDINDRGQAVVAVSDGNTGNVVAGVWPVGGPVTRLGTLGGATSTARAINERGEVAGAGRTAAGEEHAFLWRGGRMTDLGTLGGAWSTPAAPPGGPSTDPLNERGHVTGTSQTVTGEEHAFLWRGGEMVDLGTLGGARSMGMALNDRGQVVGRSQTSSGVWHAFVWQCGRMVDLGAVAGDATSMPTDINDRGQVVGWVDDVPGGRAVMWTVPPCTR
jgi:probable HAF family extracellular repeat protein